MRILSLASELFPLVKTGGLADVTGTLPLALAGLGCEVRSLVPGYPGLTGRLAGAAELAAIPRLMGGPARLLRGTAPGGADVLVLEAPHLFDSPGDPYTGPDGWDRTDNHRRFGALCRVAADLARGRLTGVGWVPDILHAHDWQAGLAPAYLALEGGPRPGTVFTVHNLAYQGFFPAGYLAELGLPPAAFRTDGLEFYGGIAFLKAGLYYADRLTTVSPTYGREIQTDAGGEGLGGLLRGRAADLVGIVNGIDTAVWDPARDPCLPATFPPRTEAHKAYDKAALQARLGLVADPDAPLLAVVSRLTWRKGIDLLLAALPELLAQGGQLAILGSGEAGLEAGLRAAARDHPGRVGCVIGYDEGLSHLVQGGADMILVPSRSEPCGLVQLIGLRYGTIPVVARTGGLADTVIDANEAALEDGVATGFQFAPGDAWALADAIQRAIQVYHRPEAWGRLVERAMTREVGWERAARRYLELYRSLLIARGMGPG